MVFTLVVLSYFMFLAYSFFSPREILSKMNVENLEKIEIGMEKEQVVEIMGEPDSVYTSYYNNKDIVYYYRPPIMASDGIEIHIDDSTNKVRTVVPYQ